MINTNVYIWSYFFGVAKRGDLEHKKAWNLPKGML